MRYAQLTMSNAEFIAVKKTALDLGLSLNNFLRLAVLEKVFSSTNNNKEENKSSAIRRRL